MTCSRRMSTCGSWPNRFLLRTATRNCRDVFLDLSRMWEARHARCGSEQESLVQRSSRLPAERRDACSVGCRLDVQHAAREPRSEKLQIVRTVEERHVVPVLSGRNELSL